MKDDKTKEQLIQEIESLKNKIAQIDGQTEKDLCLDEEIKQCNRYRTLVETTPHGIQENDTSGIITFSNPAHCKILGYSKKEMEGKAIWDFYKTEEEKEHVRSYLEMLVREQPDPAPFFGKNITKDKRIIDIQVDWNYKRDDTGNLTGFISVITDITGRKKAELAKERIQLQLLHSQKMEAIGRLAGGISHDFGNILTAIKNFSSLGIKKAGDSNPAVRDIFEHIKTASFRAINLTKQLTTFSQKEFTQVVNASMNKVINDLLLMLKHLIGENVIISTELDHGLRMIRGDVGKLEQLITNLVINARDAMPNGGVITIQTRNMIIDDGSCKKIPYARAGKFIHLLVKDTGIGIAEENLYHIFEPFFTTKKGGSGAGLGLSVVYGIIKDHQGWINVSSKAGHGTTFDIYLPAIEVDIVENANNKINIQELRGSGERILLIEDDAMVRTSTSMSLIGEGYTLFEADSSDSAMDIFHREGGRFHLIMSDLVLPDKDGLTLIQELLLLNPKLKAILNSGYIDKPIDQSKLEKHGIVFFNKPYDMQDILIAIRSLLKYA